MRVNIFLFILIICAIQVRCDSGEEMVFELPTVTVAEISKLEGDTKTVFEFTVNLVGAYKEEVTLDYRTADGTAFGGLDYVSKSGQLTFVSPDTFKTIQIEVVGDEVKESSEFFRLRLENGVNANIETPIVIANINNDDDQIPFASDGYITPDAYPTLNLIWADEFDGTALNQDDWAFDVGRGDNGWGNNEFQYYTAGENITVNNGVLTIEARKDADRNFTSSRIKTQDKRTFTYGRVDIRAKMPKGQGLWPALWMLGSDITEEGWPACGEIDIMELVGHEPNVTHGTAHWGIDPEQHIYKGKSYKIEEDFSEQFHVFSIYWEPNNIYWYLDDVLFYTIGIADMDGQPYPFNDEFYLLFNIAVGGDWPGSPDETTVFPQQMIVDYVRVFQQK